MADQEPEQLENDQPAKPADTEAQSETDSGVKSEPAADKPDAESKNDKKLPRRNPYKRLVSFFKRQSLPKKILLGLAALIIVLMVLPWTRYTLLGVFIKKSATVQVLDSQINSPVSEAVVTIHGKSAHTDGHGWATIYGVRIGKSKAVVTKEYYDTANQDVFVGLVGHKTAEVKLTANGRPLKVTVVNKINSQPVAGATLTAGQSTAKTDDKGTVTLIVDPTAKEVTVTSKAAGFNEASNKVAINQNGESATNILVVPTGKVYFLSRLSGKIDVVRTNLDGSARETVLAGTGHEDQQATVLLASRDWKYLALQSDRDTNTNDNKLYLIDTTDNNKLSTIDEGNATFTLDGWLDDNLVYQVDRSDVQSWQSDKFRLKSFNAVAKNLIVLDKSTAVDKGSCSTEYGSYAHCYNYQSYAGVTITDDEVIYAKNVNSIYAQPEGQIGMYAVKPDNSGRRTVFEQAYTGDGIYGYTTYKPAEINYQIGDVSYEYEVGGKPIKIDSKTYSDNQSKYLNFVVSPDGKETFWAESRDGKNSLFIGNLDLAEGKQIANLSELKPYGWFTKDYLLLSKNGSELYILGRNGGTPLKVSDYHKPNINYNGYGYGYGGN